MTQVEVWNADETLLHRVSVRHAVRMIWRGIATPVEVHESETFGPYQVPLVVRLVRYVEMKWLYSRTRADLLARGCPASGQGPVRLLRQAQRHHDGPRPASVPRGRHLVAQRRGSVR